MLIAPASPSGSIGWGRLRPAFAVRASGRDPRPQVGDLGATLVDWRCRLQTPPGKHSMVLGGDHFFGLGIRFLAAMDEGGRFSTPHQRGEMCAGDERLTPAKWCAYTAKADSTPVTVAIFDHPDNLRHPAKMFTMSKPFAYLGHDQRVERAGHRRGRPPVGLVLWRCRMGWRGRQISHRKAIPTLATIE